MQERTEKCRWQSRFGGGFIADGQYLAENMCDRIARRKGQTLGVKFWDRTTSKVWNREFLLQLKYANSLLKNFAVEAIIAALRSPKGKSIFSFAWKSLYPLVEEEQGRLNHSLAKQAARLAQADPEPPSPVPALPEGPRPSFVSNKSPLAKLRELDG